MAYDFHGSWDETIDHNSPLYSRRSEIGDASYLNVDWAVNYWLQRGFPKEKFVLGLATYGRPFKLKNPSLNEPGHLNDGAGTPGKFTREKGFLSYYEICTKILKDGWTKKWSDEQKVPYAYGDNEWVGYEDVNSLRIKARYIVDKDLAGAMFWSLSLDDFSGAFCNEGKYPLINTVRNEFTSYKPLLSLKQQPPQDNSVNQKNNYQQNRQNYVNFPIKNQTSLNQFLKNKPQKDSEIQSVQNVNNTQINFDSYQNKLKSLQNPILNNKNNLDYSRDDGNKNKEKLFVCYFTNWAQYRPTSGKFMPEQIDPSLCTHIIYAFAKVVDDRLVAYEWNDEDTQYSKGLYSKTIELKKQNPRLKVLIGVGGWNHGPEPFSLMVHDDLKRANFIRNCVDFIQKNRFDGLDLDWEYPGSRNGSRPSDKQLFTTLVQELQTAFRPYNFLLTAAVAAGHENIDKAYEIDKIANYLDFVCLMSYDFHGSWEETIDHNSPLYSRRSEIGDASYLNVDWAVNYWLQRGFPKEKFVLGLATYGRPFKLKNPSLNEPGHLNDGAGTPGKFTREKGFLSYYEICTKILKDGWTKKWSDEQKVPYAYGDNEWVGYEDVNSLRIKARYIVDKDLAGAMFWSLSLDDFSGAFCNEGKYPLINTVRKVILESSNNQKINSRTNKPFQYDNNYQQPNLLDLLYPQEILKLTTRKNYVNNYEKFECLNDGLFADFSNHCRAFIQCFRSKTKHAIKVRFFCPDGTLFNQEKSVCDWPNNVIC